MAGGDGGKTNEAFRQMVMATPRGGGGGARPRPLGRAGGAAAQTGAERPAPPSAPRAARPTPKGMVWRKGKLVKKGGEKGGEGEGEEDDGPRYRDRAKERREGALEARAEAAAAAGEFAGEELRAGLSVEESKLLGGDAETTHLVKGLDVQLLKRTREELAEMERQTRQEDGDGADGERPAAFKSEAAKAIFEVAVNGTTTARRERAAATFTRGRTAYVFDMVEGAASGGVASDVPSMLQRPRAEWEADEERVLVSADTLVISKIVQLMSYMRTTSERRKFSKKKEKVAKSMGMTVEQMEAMLKRQGLAEAASMAGIDNVPGLGAEMPPPPPTGEGRQQGQGQGRGPPPGVMPPPPLPQLHAAQAAAQGPAAPAGGAPDDGGSDIDDDIFGDVGDDEYVCEPAAAPTAAPEGPQMPSSGGDYGLEGFEGPAVPADAGHYGLPGMEDAAGPQMPSGDGGDYGLPGMEDAAGPHMSAPELAPAPEPAPAPKAAYFEGLSAKTDANARHAKAEEAEQRERDRAAAKAAPAALAAASAPAAQKVRKAPKGDMAFGAFDADDADGGYEYGMDVDMGRYVDDDGLGEDDGKTKNYDAHVDRQLGRIRNSLKEKHGEKHEGAFGQDEPPQAAGKRGAGEEGGGGGGGRQHKRLRL